MNYIYKTVMGNHEIEVDEQLYNILDALDREEHNADRKYYRHNPISLSCIDCDGKWMDDGSDILGDLVDEEAARNILSCLTEQQQYRIKKCCLDGWTFTDLAIKEGVSEDAIRYAVERAKKRIKILLKQAIRF